MHQCLSIQEILGHICLYLKESDLLSAALICRLFKPAALRHLWQDLPGLSPVVHCLPSDACKMIKSERRLKYGSLETTKKFVLARELLPRDWEDVLPYLPMIRSINSNKNSLCKIHISEDVFKNMISSFPGATLFPNLRRLSASSLTQNLTDFALAFIELCLGPRLERVVLQLTVASSVPSRTSLVSSIPLSCPILRKLELDSEYFDLSAVSEAVCQCHHLEELLVPTLSEAALAHVSQLSGLRDLQLNAISPSVLITLPRVSVSAFPVLEKLRTVGNFPSFSISINAAINSHKYENYRGTFSRTATVVEWKSLFTQLARVLRKPHAITFEDEAKPRNPEYSRYLITPDVFRPILSLTGIGLLCMESIFTFDLDDSFILELAKACPKLRYVVLGTMWSSGRRSKATLMSFVHLLRHCPELWGIGLVIDASGVDRGMRKNPAKGVNVDDNSEITFHVGDSYIEDPIAVASFLSSLIDPFSEDEVSILVAEDCPVDIAETWSTVAELIPAFAAVRAQEISEVGDMDESGDEEDENGH